MKTVSVKKMPKKANKKAKKLSKQLRVHHKMNRNKAGDNNL